MFAKIINRVDDWVNPIAVKEIRQSINSNTILLTIVGVLLAELTGLFISIGASGNDSDLGKGFFIVLLVVLGISAFFCVGMVAAGRFAREREKSAMDLMHTTILSPYSIMWGKLLSAMIMITFLFSLFVPFMCVSYYLKGIDILTIIYSCYISFIVAIPLMTALIMLGSFGINKGARFLIGGGAAAICWGFLSSFSMTRHMPSISFGPNNIFMIFFWITLAALIIAGLFFLISVSVISHMTANRIFPLRMYIAGLWLLLGIIAGCMIWYTGKKDYIVLWYVPTTLIAVGVIIASTMERITQTRRVLKQVPKSFLKRVAHFLLSSGTVNALMFGGLIIMINFLIIETVIGWDKSWLKSGHIAYIFNMLGIFAYFYSCLALLVKRAMNRFFPQIIGFVYFLFIAAAFTIIPGILSVVLSMKFDRYRDIEYYLFCASPVSLTYNSYEKPGMVIAVGMLLIGTVLNLRFFIKCFQTHKNPDDVSLTEQKPGQDLETVIADGQ